MQDERNSVSIFLLDSPLYLIILNLYLFFHYNYYYWYSVQTYNIYFLYYPLTNKLLSTKRRDKILLKNKHKERNGLVLNVHKREHICGHSHTYTFNIAHFPFLKSKIILFIHILVGRISFVFAFSQSDHECHLVLVSTQMRTLTASI